jgi:hypothetical protein
MARPANPKTIKAIFDFLDAHRWIHKEYSVRHIARMAKCSPTTAQRWKKRWIEGHQQELDGRLDRHDALDALDDLDHILAEAEQPWIKKYLAALRQYAEAM